MYVYTYLYMYVKCLDGVFVVADAWARKYLVMIILLLPTFPDVLQRVIVNFNVEDIQGKLFRYSVLCPPS